MVMLLRTASFSSMSIIFPQKGVLALRALRAGSMLKITCGELFLRTGLTSREETVLELLLF